MDDLDIEGVPRVAKPDIDRAARHAAYAGSAVAAARADDAPVAGPGGGYRGRGRSARRMWVVLDLRVRDAGADASGTPAVCTQADALVSSVQQLADIDVIKQGTSSLNTAVQNVQTQVQALSQSASEQFKPQVDALQSAINNLQSVLHNLGSSPNLAQAAGQIASAVTQVTTATQNLVSALSSTCPGGVATVAPTGTSVSPS